MKHQVSGIEPTLTDDQTNLRERARAYALQYQESAVQWDRDDHVDMKMLLQDSAKHGLTGITIPGEYGGPGLGATEWTIIINECARASRSWLAGDPTFFTSGPGPMLIASSGNEALKGRILPQLVKGETSVAIALTEPKAGSAMTDLATTATMDGDEVIVHGAKRHISNVGSGLADYMTVFCRFDSIPGAKGIGVVLVETDADGVSFGRNPGWIGLKGSPHRSVRLDSVRVPRDNVLFQRGRFGELMLAFNYERLHNATLSLGLAEAAFDLTVDFVGRRQQFGRPIVDFQGVQWQLADMFTDIEAARLLVYQCAANAADGGKLPQALDVSTAKLYANEMATRVVYMAAQLHGAIGFTDDQHVERILRDVLTMPIAGGTPNILRNVIAAGLFPGSKFSQRVASSASPA